MCSCGKFTSPAVRGSRARITSRPGNASSTCARAALPFVCCQLLQVADGEKPARASAHSATRTACLSRRVRADARRPGGTPSGAPAGCGSDCAGTSDNHCLDGVSGLVVSAECKRFKSMRKERLIDQVHVPVFPPNGARRGSIDLHSKPLSEPLRAPGWGSARSSRESGC